MLFGRRSHKIMSKTTPWCQFYNLLIKNSSYILIAIYYSIYFYELFSDLISNYIIIPNSIFIICLKTNTFGKICSYIRK